VSDAAAAAGIRRKAETVNRAVVVDAPGSYRIVPTDPAEPQLGEARVRVVAAGMCGSDREIYAGTRLAPYVRYPVIPGHEWSGVVEAVGPGVPADLVGSAVVGEGFRACFACARCRSGATNLCEAGYDETGFTQPGAFADFLVLPARLLHVLAEGSDLRAAPLLEPAACAADAIAGADIQPGERVAVVGAGTLGLLAIALAAMRSPAELVAIDPRRSQEPLARRMGATAFATPDALGAGTSGDMSSSGSSGAGGLNVGTSGGLGPGSSGAGGLSVGTSGGPGSGSSGSGAGYAGASGGLGPGSSGSGAGDAGASGESGSVDSSGAGDRAGTSGGVNSLDSSGAGDLGAELADGLGSSGSPGVSAEGRGGGRSAGERGLAASADPDNWGAGTSGGPDLRVPVGAGEGREAKPVRGGFDVVVEAAGVSSSARLAAELARRGGRVALIGIPGDPAAALPVGFLVGQQLTVTTVFGASAAGWLAAVRAFNTGLLDLAPLVTHELPLEDFGSAIELLASGGPEVGKILLRP
jgi:threonine dehydrogenase-like Zn-dependent dehydrogenase